MHLSDLTVRQVATQVEELILAGAEKGLLLPRTFDSLLNSLTSGDGHAVVCQKLVMAYAECREGEMFHIIRSVVSRQEKKGGRHGTAVMVNRIKECWRRDPQKDVVLACSPNLATWYKRFGFEEKSKEDAPESIIGGRTKAEWMECDRIWMVCTKSAYHKQKELGSMAKPNAFVKMSGNLLEDKTVLEWLHELAKVYFVAICIGGGEQINEAFNRNGYPIKFGPLGRITSSLAERQLARDVLEQNQALIQDLLDDNGISARAIIPVENIGGVLCHVNGDVMLLSAYNGYDRLYLLTMLSRVEKKRLWLKKLAEVFEVIEKGELEKIEVIGF